MKKYFAKILLFCFIIISLADIASAKDVKFETSVDKDRIALGETAQLGLTFYGAQDIPAPDIGNIEGLDVRYLGPSTMMTVINGKVSSSITYMYTILPLKTGKFQLGPLSFRYKGDGYSSNTVFLEVSEEAPARIKEEKTPQLENLGLEDRIFLTLSVEKKTAYVNELIPVVVKLYVQRLNVRDIQLPTFDQEGFSKIEFKEPKQYREQLGGLIYDVLEFKTNIFGTRPGEYKLGPAKVKCNLIVKKRLTKTPSRVDDFFDDEFTRDSFFDDFFTHYERYPMELKSRDTTIVGSPLPSEGRPVDFSGAVGDYQFIFNAEPKKVKVGDPITLHMDINGLGNFNTVLMPRLENTDGFKVYEPQAKTEKSRKSFLQVLIPETDQILQIPKAVFDFFDPYKKEYKTISQGPIPIQVEKGREEAPPQVVGPITSVSRPVSEQEEIRRDIIYIKESPGRLITRGRKIYKNKILLPVLAIPFIFLILLYIVQLRRERLRRDTKYARRIRALKMAKRSIKKLKHQINSDEPRIFYEIFFKSLQEYLGDRLGIPSGGITYDAVDSLFGTKEVDLGIMRKLKNLFETCDRVRFALLKIDEFKMKDDLKELEEIVKYFERIKL